MGALSEHYVGIRDEVRGTIAIMPVGWVGDPALIVPIVKLDDFKKLVERL